jgi:predicted Ser/Thr protein kinase
VLVGPAAEVISKLARDAGVSFGTPLRLDELDHHLAASDWEPPHDVLRRLSSWNSWAAAKLNHSLSTQAPEEPGMVAFFVRREGAATGLQSDIASTIEACGFELLQTIDLNDEEIEMAARAARGANWGGGALPVNGGPPVSIIVAYDVFPSPVTDDVRERYPFLDNGRTLVAKLMCRQLIRDRLPANRRFNPVHSTDDSVEAWRVVRMFAAKDEPALRELTESRKAAMATEYEVVKTLTRKAARAKVELIRYKGGLAVKKTYRENCLRFLEREASFMNAISPERPEILPVLERGHNYFIMPFIEGRSMRQGMFGRTIPKLMTLKQIRSVADLLRYLFSRGYDPVDLAPHNMIVDRSGRLTAIDFEFVHRTDGPIPPEKSACLDGIPDDFEGEWPAAARWSPTQSKSRSDPYRERWFGYTGLSRKSFLHDPPAVQAMKRAVNYPQYLGAKASTRLFRWLRSRAKHSIKRGLPVISRIAVNAVRTKGSWS